MSESVNGPVSRQYTSWKKERKWSSASRSVSPTESVDVPGCEAPPGTDLPDISEDSGDSTSAVPELSGRRACCDADPAGAEDCRVTSASVQRQSVDSSCATANRCHTVPQLQFIVKVVNIPVVTQRQIPVQRVQKEIETPQVQFPTRWSMLLLCRFTCARHGKDGRDPTVAACTAKR